MSATVEDRYLPNPDVESSHRITVRAPAAAVYRAVLETDLCSSAVIRMLFRLRGMPTDTMTLDGLGRIRFVRLTAEPDSTVLLGLIGKFWTPSGHLQRFSPEEFASFDRAGFAKATWGFHIVQHGVAQCELITSTRIRCIGATVRRLFRAYWLIVGPFSHLIRRATLQAMRRRAEGETLIHASR